MSLETLTFGGVFMVQDSILGEIKKMLGISEDDTSYDTDIIIHINSVFMILNQLGLGPNSCFSISDKTSTWSEFNENSLDFYAPIKTYVYLRVKLVFDPPTNSFLLQSINDEIKELEYRLKEYAENLKEDV